MSEVLSPSDLYRELINHPEGVQSLIELGNGLPAIPLEAVTEAEKVQANLVQSKDLLDLNGSVALPDNGLRRLALTFAFVNASARRKKWWCPHALLLDRVSYSVLTPGVVFCLRCQEQGERYVEKYKVEDGVCDICDVQSAEFWPVVVQDVLGVFIASACDECRDFVKLVISEKRDGPA